MTFTEIQTAVTDYCLLTSSVAVTRVGKAINRHYRRITSQIGMDATRFVTRSVGTTIGLQTVTFDEIEKIDRIFDATDATAVRLLDEISIHEQRSTQPNDGEPSSWALQHTDADSVTVLLSTTSAASYTLYADGWTTLSDLSGADEPVIPESFHDILVWYVIAEELLKKEKDKLAATYTLKAEKLLSDLRFHLADSPTRDTRQGGSSVLAISGSGGGSASIVSTDFIKGGVNVGDYASLAAAITAIGSSQRTLVIHQSTPVTANTTIPANAAVFVTGAGQFVISAAMTLTIAGSLMAERHKIFSGAGSVDLDGGKIDGVYPEWWATNTTPGTTDMLAALNAASATGCRVLLGPTTYGITGQWVLANGDDVVEGVRWTNEGTGPGSEIKCLAAGACVSVTGLRSRLRRFGIDGNGIANYGIYFADSGGLGGVFEEIEIWECLGTPGMGVATVDRNNNWSWDRLKSTGNKIGASFIGRCEKTTLREPQLYGNLTTNLQIGDGTQLIQDFRIYGGQIEILGTEGGAVTNIGVNYVQPLLVSGVYFESATAAASKDIHVQGTELSIVSVHACSFSGNNIANDAFVFTAPAIFSLKDSRVKNYSGGYEIDDASGTSSILIENSLIDFISASIPVMWHQTGPALIGVIADFADTAIAKLNVGADNAAYALIQEKTADNGDVAGLLLGSSSSAVAQIKGAVIFEKTTTFGRGALALCVNNAATDANVTKADAKVTIAADGTVTLSGQTTITADTPIIFKSAALVEAGRILANTAPSIIYRPGASGHHIWQNSGGLELLRVTDAGLICINDSANAKQTIGLTINQGGADDEILALKSSDVAHGITTETETDTFATAAKVGATTGGVWMKGYGTGTSAFVIGGITTSEDATRSTAATGPIQLRGSGVSAAAAAALAADKNIVVVTNNGTTRFILDSDGDSHQDVGTAWTNFDDHDDVAVLQTLAAHVTRLNDPLRDAFGSWLLHSRDTLERLELVTFNDDGHHFINMSRLTMLLVGAARQMGQRMQQLERRLLSLEGEHG